MEIKEKLISQYKSLLVVLIIIYMFCPMGEVGKDGFFMPAGLSSLFMIVVSFFEVFSILFRGEFSLFGDSDGSRMIILAIYGISSLFVPLYIRHKLKERTIKSYEKISYLMAIPLLVLFIMSLIISQEKGPSQGIVLYIYHIFALLILIYQGKKIDK